MSKMLKVVGASWLQTKISSYILGLLGVLAILALFVGQIERTQEDGTFTATVFYSKKTGYSIEYWGQSNELSDIQKGVARAYFRMDIDTTGWSVLEIETDGSYPDDVQAYAAGIVEGALTWYPIHAHLDNTIRSICENREKQCEKLREALDRSVEMWKSHAAERQKDPFWHQVSLYYVQMRGVYTGWKHGVERSQNEYDTDISDLYWLNALADVKEIQRKLNITLGDEELYDLPSLSTAFLRITDEYSEEGKLFKKLYVAHNTAGSYSSMTRILKRYKFNYSRTADPHDTTSVPGSSVEFSGYPGSITSQDEFYILRGHHHKLIVTATPLNNYNNKLWKDINITEQLPVSPRVAAANRLATNVSSWTHIIAKDNSGTASKQWLVVDLTLLDKQKIKQHKKPSASTNDYVTEVSEDGRNKYIKHTIVHNSNSNAQVKGLLWLIEQVPGRTHSADLSDSLLEKGYWATYGLPFFKDIAVAVNLTAMEDKYGNIFSEPNSPRALTFKENFSNATSIDSILKLMRYNNLTVLTSNINSSNDAAMQIMVEKYMSYLGNRLDITSKNKIAYGIIDTKIASGTSKGDSVEFVAVSGPPYTMNNNNSTEVTKLNKGNVAPIYINKFDDQSKIHGMEVKDLVKYSTKNTEDQIPPFQWSNSEFKDESHEGLPDRWAFKPFAPKWSW